jgi:hypothetical protein
VFKTLKEAEEAAKKFLATGAAAYGCCLIDRQVFERPHIDGKLIGVPAAWERQQTYEIAMDGETMAIER